MARWTQQEEKQDYGAELFSQTQDKMPVWPLRSYGAWAIHFSFCRFITGDMGALRAFLQDYSKG
jgi:hypothetical protein